MTDEHFKVFALA